MSSGQDSDNKFRLPASPPADLHQGQDRTVVTGNGQLRVDAAAPGLNQNASYPSLQMGPFSTGQLVGSYRIVNFLGQGGMGFVYRVEHVIMKRELALKVLRNTGVSANDWRRFQTEAQAIARLDHPNIVKIYDMNQSEDGLPYYTMDLLLGQSLADYIESRGRLPIAEALPIFRQVASGLAYAHDRGIIHRDIKPANIMLLPGRPATNSERALPIAKIVDFGIAKLTAQDNEVQGVTRPGEIFGSPIYMSPEQCSGQKVDYHTDMYSLGVSFYEALTGKPPFVGRTAVETTAMHQTRMSPSLSEGVVGQNFPEALEDMVTRLLAKNPQRRYQSLAEMASELLTMERGPRAIIDTDTNTVTGLSPAGQEPQQGQASTFSGWQYARSTSSRPADKGGWDSKPKDPPQDNGISSGVRNIGTFRDQIASRFQSADSVPEAGSIPARADEEASDEKLDWEFSQSSVRRPNRNTARMTTSGRTANHSNTQDHKKILLIVITVLLAAGLIGSAGIYLINRPHNKTLSRSSTASSMNFERIPATSQADREPETNSIFTANPDLDKYIKQTLHVNEPYSTITRVNGVPVREFKFPDKFSLGTIYWSPTSKVEAQGLVRVPAAMPCKLEASPALAYNPRLLKRFRADELVSYSQTHSPEVCSDLCQELSKLSSLKKISISNTDIPAVEISALNKLKNLDFLYLHYTGIDQERLAGGPMIRRLQALEVSGPISAKLLTALEESKNLQSLGITNCHLNADQARLLSRLKVLRTLQLKSCIIAPAFMNELSQSKSIRTLCLDRTHDTSLPALTPLKNLSSLRRLELDFTKASDDHKLSADDTSPIANTEWTQDEIQRLRELVPNTSILDSRSERETPMPAWNKSHR